ncbi:MAG: SRPBCC family protein [Methylovulum sp.]|nr:SRPBCC family protein [Methylovulum sp.]
MLEIILVSTIIAVIVCAIIVARQPADFCISRTAVISAPVSTVFEQVNDLAKWEPWSPWAKLDPAATNTFEGPASGVGAVMSWSGNNKVGAGRMTITASRPDEAICFRLEFLKPFKATNTAEFTFKPDADKTVVTWSMSGTNNFIGKAMSLVMNCDKMVGGQFEQGLATIKALVETA